MIRHFSPILMLVSSFMLIFSVLAIHPNVSVLATGAHLMLSLKSGPPTTRLKLNGTGFGSNETINVNFDTTQVGSVLTNNKGVFLLRIDIPASAAPGNHTIQANGQVSGTLAQAAFFVLANWSMYGFSSQGSHFNPYENVLNSSNLSGLALAWRVSTANFITSSPTVVNGVVYIGSQDGHLYAFDASSGATIWIAVDGGGPDSPAVVNEVVYVASQDNLGNNYLYAFKATTGKVLWKTPLGGPSQSPPTIVNGVVYIGSQDGKLYAFNALSGTVLWVHSVYSYISSSPALAKGIVYVSSGNGTVYALNAKTGTLLWNYSTGDSIDHSSPSVMNGIVYVGTANNLYALNATTGKLTWMVAAGNKIIPSLAVANGIVYYGSKQLYAFDARTGKVRWSGAYTGSFITAISVANGVAYADSYTNGTLYAFNALTGEKLWSYIVGGYLFSSPAVANGTVYVGSFDDYLYAFHLACRSNFPALPS